MMIEIIRTIGDIVVLFAGVGLAVVALAWGDHYLRKFIK